MVIDPPGIPALVGTPMVRLEDDELLRGTAVFLDDVYCDALEVAFVRSTNGHARVVDIDVSPALDVPGLVAIYTWEDLGPDVGRPLPVSLPHPDLSNPRTAPALARDLVLHVGQAVAMVVATDRYAAEDAASLIRVAYEPLPVVADLAAAIDGHRVVHSDMANNLAGSIVQTAGDPEAALADAPHTLRLELSLQRSMASPLEGRGVLARPDGAGVHIMSSTQVPHAVQAAVAHMLRLSPHLVRVTVPHVGGAFGVKGVRPWPEEVLVPWASRRLGRPVKWTEDRTEHFVSSAQERQQLQTVTVGFDDDGRVLAYDVEISHDIGAFSQYGLVVSQNTASHCAGPYRIDHKRVTVNAYYTNLVMVAPYRGAGRPEATFVLERMMDAVARECSLDRVEVRRRNLATELDLPLPQGLIGQDRREVVLDTGQYHVALDRACELSGWDTFASRREQAAGRGRRLGIGIACYVENSGLGPFEGCIADLLPDGRVRVAVGTAPQGQGHRTFIAQIACDELQMSPAQLEIVMGDTALLPAGVGTFASRTAAVTGPAVQQATAQLAERIKHLAADILECDTVDVELVQGRARVRGQPGSGLSYAALAAGVNPIYGFSDQAAELRAGGYRPAENAAAPVLRAENWHYPAGATYPYGVHVAVVETDPATANIDVIEYYVVHDCGTVINPMIVDGQVQGGVAQGVGGALYERMDYDEHGQLLNASFMDFLMPYATEVPDARVAHLETPSLHNALGVKGAGEAGVIPASAVIAAALEDAEGLPIRRMPVSPSELYDLRCSGAA
jgi:CO/xanthine dehydrogenase Mo-binding subunit